MMQTVLQIVIVICLVTPIIAGYRDGLYTSVYSASRTFFGFMVAMTFTEPIRDLVLNMVPRLRIHPGPKYLEAVIWPTLLALVIGLTRTLKMRYTIPRVEAWKLVDKIGGPAVGLFHGILFAGLLVLLWSYMPFAKYMPGDSGRVVEKRLFWDAGATAIRFYSYMTHRMPGSRKFLLHDEPILQDVNGNGLVDKGSDDKWDDNEIPNGKWDQGHIDRYRKRDEFGPWDVQNIFSEPDLE